MIPYGRQWLDEDDIAAVVEVLRSDWLTTGPKISQFEEALAKAFGTAQAVAVCNGTAALHSAMFALEIGAGDEVIVPAMTFAATANAVVFQGGTPVFADVDPATLLLDPAQVKKKITARTKAVIAVDYAGQPCDYDRLQTLSQHYGFHLIADACHSPGGSYRGRPVGSLAEMSTFSFHPVKHITTGEGGAITTDNAELAGRMRLFRNHGITTDHYQRDQQGSWFYEMVDLGYNYRLTDIQCALGLSQLGKLPQWIKRRQKIAQQYDNTLATLTGITPLQVRPEVSHAYHLYMIKVDLERFTVDRGSIFKAFREAGVMVNVHYIPVHLHPYYRAKWQTGPGMCPVAEAAYGRLITLPIFPKMTDADVSCVIETMQDIWQRFHRF